jgi:hypothetical protein
MTTARGFLGAGDTYIDLFDPTTGAATGFVAAGDASKFEIKPNSDIKELISKGRDTYGQVIESAGIGKPADLTITLRESNKANLTAAFMGVAATLTQASGAVSDEVVTAKLGKYVQLAGENLDATVDVTNSAGSTHYVEGTDFLLNRRLGWFMAIIGGAITDAQSLKIDYTKLAITGSKISGAAQAQLRCAVVLDGVNFADGKPTICRVWEAVLVPDSPFDFLKDDWNELTLKGRLKTPIGKTSPFQVDLRDA